MPSYKLIYFSFKARGEVARLLFAIAGVEYEDMRVDRQLEWPQIKAKMPFGQMPVLEVDGQMLSQSRVIEAFLARRFGLAGKTDWDQARAAMITDCVEDMRTCHRKIFLEKNEEKKAELRTEFEQGAQITHFTNFENVLKDHSEGDVYFVGDQLTHADVSFYHHTSMIHTLTGITVDWEKWPRLRSLRDKVESHPGVAEWLAKRPLTVM